MGILYKLDPEERDYFALVNRAVLTNPFSDERERIDKEIAGRLPGNDREHPIDAAIREVSSRLKRLRLEGRLDISRYHGEDRQVLERSLAFDVFYCHVDRLDQLIQDQIARGEAPLKVDFAEEMLGAMQTGGISRGAARRYLEYSFQFRRAYFFIFRGLIGRSKGMRHLRERLWNNVFTMDLDIYNHHLRDRMEDFSTLILGETGTGKGTVAAAIGQSGFIPFDEKTGRFSESFTRSFIELNLSQFPETLIESELFGHRQGAFTGAIYNHEGVFSRCSQHGAIFLDEIGEVSQPIQIKLLKVLEERQFSPVGSHDMLRFKGRVIAATNRAFNDIVRHKILREDFLYRMCSDVIVVPPLRQRIEEDPRELDDLLAHTVQRIIGRPSKDLAALCRKIISSDLGGDYPWPGNVRELGQCIRQILLNRTCKSIHQVAMTGADPHRKGDAKRLDLDAQGLLQQYCHRLYREFGTYGAVARRTRLDRRTVKKYILKWQEDH
jgi:DNA-binding NtrC family response regulator